MYPAAAIFEEELRRRAIQYAYTLDGGYQIEFDGGAIVVNLDNASLDFDRDVDPGRILRYIESALAVFAPLPPWDEAQNRIYWCPEPSDTGLGIPCTRA